MEPTLFADSDSSHTHIRVKSNRIAFIVGTLQTGGIERLVTNWSLYLKEKTEWEPMVICVLKKSGPFLQTLEANGIVVEECRLDQRGFTFKLSKLLKRLNPTVVHSQVAFSMPWQVLGILLSGSRRIVFTQHNEYQNWKPLNAKLRLRLYFTLFFRFIDHYTCVSEKVQKSLSILLSRSKENFLVIPNSIDTNVFFPETLDRDQQRARLQLDDTMFLVGMVARFSPQKGHQYLIEAAKLLKAQKIRCKILLVGIGELEKDIRQQVDQHHLSEMIIFYGQSLAVQNVLRALDCFVLPSLWEGMPLALLEAMASGVPVIGTDVSGTREIIKNNLNGILIPVKDPVAIADAIIKLKESFQFRMALRDYALNAVRDEYSIEVTMSSYIKLYENK